MTRRTVPADVRLTDSDTIGIVPGHNRSPRSPGPSGGLIGSVV